MTETLRHAKLWPRLPAMAKLQRNQVWTDETRGVIRHSWGEGLDEIDVAFAVNEEVKRLHSAAGRSAHPLTSPRGVLYMAHEVGLISEDELNLRLEQTRTSKWKRAYSARRAEKGLNQPARRYIISVDPIGSVPLGDTGSTAERFDSVITGPLWVTGLRFEGERFAILGWTDPSRAGDPMPLTEGAIALSEDFEAALTALTKAGWKKHGCRKLRAFWCFVVDGEMEFDGFTVDLAESDAGSPQDA